MSPDRTTNEWEFQGNVVSWVNAELARRPALGLELATQEPSKVTRNRNDVVVWRNRASNEAFLTLELKTPETFISDQPFFDDACKKAQRWNSPFFALWNMQSAEVYRTPPVTRLANRRDRIKQFPTLTTVRSVDDWIDLSIREQLRQQALDLLDAAWSAAISRGFRFPLDASVFVDRLTRRISELRAEVQPALARRASRSRNLRTRLRQIAAAQGFLGFVDDINAAIAGQLCYRLVGQILFYFALKRKQDTLPALEPDKTKTFSEAVRPFWNSVRQFDYEALFEPHELDELVPLTDRAQGQLHDIIEGFNKYDWNILADDVLGAVFEQLIPKREQILLGQFYTRTNVADLLLGLAIEGECPRILDPGCGSGTFLLRSYQYLHDTQRLTHSQLLPMLWGFDISPFATEMSVINLYRQNLTEANNFPRVLSGDFFSRFIGQQVDFPPARTGFQVKVTLPIPRFDAIVANPPYLRSQQQDDLDPSYKKRLCSLVATEHGMTVTAKTDLFAFFIYHSYDFLRPSGRLAFVTSASWLTADYGYQLQRFLLEKMRLIAVFASETESFFSQVEQNTVLFVAEKRRDDEICDEQEIIRFITLKKRLDDLLPLDHTHWSSLQQLVARIDTVSGHYEDDSMRIRCISATAELEDLRQTTQPRNWSLPLRAPNAYYTLIAATKIGLVPIEELADCHLGYKSLQNRFFYLDSDTIARYEIEREFLKPIYQLGDLQENLFFQQSKPRVFLLHCDRPQADLRGSGAYRYIRDMQDKPAALKKQTGRVQTISEALGRQGGAYWYGPKATPQEAHVWVRKAFDKTYSPFLFEQPMMLDQRCNYLLPHRGISWQALAAVLTSSVFALSIEAAGSASMGGGALEIPTTKLSNIMVPDIRQFSRNKLGRLVDLAEAVWEYDVPVNWRDSEIQPSTYLRNLDEFLLSEIGAGISPDALYEAIRHTLSVRMRLAQDKSKSKRRAEATDIAEVARTIVSNFTQLIEARRFPESFTASGIETMPIEIDPRLDLDVSVEPFLEECEVQITSPERGVILDVSLPRMLADVLVRALLMGRRSFSIPLDPDAAGQLMQEFWNWLPPLLSDIKAECKSSSLGTRFEGEIEKAAMTMLGWSHRLIEPAPYGHFRLLPVTDELGASKTNNERETSQ